MPTTLMLKPRVMDPRAKDDISDALKAIVWKRQDGESQKEYTERMTMPLGYFSNYYPEGLRQQILGPHARKLVGVSRYYPTLTPPVVVDFEPAPPDPWHLELKQQFFFTRGILFLPIYLNDRLTDEQFAERYREAAAVVADKGLQGEIAAAKVPDLDVEAALTDSALLGLIEARARQLAAEQIAAGGKHVNGAARNWVIKRNRDELVATIRGKLRHGMDRDQCYREIADAAQRQSDGQVHPPVAGRSGA